MEVDADSRQSASPSTMSMAPRLRASEIGRPAHILLLLLLEPVLGLIALPGNVSRVFLNIGSHLDPMAAPPDLSTVVVAFEPIVGCQIQPRERLYVLHAAVAETDSVATMGVYHRNQGSSSLSAPAKRFGFASLKQQPALVPVLSMRTVLSSFPSHVALWFMKTDMQGYDFAALKAGGELLARVHYIRTECWLMNRQSYSGVQNDFCADLFPYLTAHGFRFVHMHGNSRMRRYVNEGRGLWGHEAALAYCEAHRADPRRADIAEADAYFVREGTPLPYPTGPDWPFRQPTL
jgi:hypothetical protein